MDKTIKGKLDDIDAKLVEILDELKEPKTDSIAEKKAWANQVRFHAAMGTFPDADTDHANHGSGIEIPVLAIHLREAKEIVGGMVAIIEKHAKTIKRIEGRVETIITL